VRRLAAWVLVAIALSSAGACDDAQSPPAEKPAPPAESRPTTSGEAPAANAVVAREGDHLVVFVDVPAAGVESVSVEVDAPSDEVRTSQKKGPELLEIEIRVPASTKELKLVGVSRGGAAWSRIVRTALDG
jgi:hypothetical protein